VLPLDAAFARPERRPQFLVGSMSATMCAASTSERSRSAQTAQRLR
jgi:hypothetical protein